MNGPYLKYEDYKVVERSDEEKETSAPKEKRLFPCYLDWDYNHPDYDKNVLTHKPTTHEYNH